MKIFALLTAIPATGETLADVLRKQVPNTPLPPADLQLPIASYEVLNDATHFVMGYYTITAGDPRGLHPPLRVLLLDKRKGSWQHREIQGQTASLEEPENSCAGSVLDIRLEGLWFFFVTHLTPSASCTFVLSRSLEVKHILFARPVAFFSSGRVIVQGNTAHFAATHPLKLTLYDPTTDAEITLLPRQDDIALKEITDDLSELADESWCRENNASCEPEDLTGSPEVMANDHTNAAAFRVVYSGEGYGPKARDFQAEVVYIFDFSRKPIEYREFRPDVLKKRIGSYRLEDLAQPVVLQRWFVTKARKVPVR